MRHSLVIFCVSAMVVALSAVGAPLPQKPLAEFAYRPAGKLIYVSVTVNGAHPRWYCFDSGAPHSIVDRQEAELLGIRSLATETIGGTGLGDVAAANAGPVIFSVGGLPVRADHTQLVDLSAVPLPGRVSGLIGVELIEQYVVRVDPIKHRISLYDPKAFRYRGRGAAVPLELTDGRLFIQLRLAVAGDVAIPRKLRVDTGSEDSVDDDSVKRSAILTRTTLGNGLGESYEGDSGVYDSVQIGPYILHNVWGPAGAVPIVGMEILRRFTMIFDAGQGVLYLEPNAALREAVPAPN
jgi:hypothetical protein